MLALALALPVLLVLSAIASGSETALFSLTRGERAQLARAHPVKGRAVERLLARPRMLLIQVLLANMLVNMTYFVVTSVLTIRAEGAGAKLAISAGSVLAIVVGGEVFAKVLAASLRVRVCLTIALPMLALQRAMSPVLVVLDHGVIAPLSRLVRPHERGESNATMSEIGLVLAAGVRQGALSEDEQRLLSEVVRLGDLRVREVMTPRVDLDWIRRDASRREVLEVVARTGRTTLPVCSVSLDEGVDGLLHVNRYLGDPNEGVRIDDHLRRVMFIPEQAPLDRVLNMLRDASDHTAIVVDEVGVVTGLVQIEDIADELLEGMGENAPTEQSRVEMVALGEWVAPGRLSLRDWEESFGGREPEGERLIEDGERARVSTLGGLVQSRLGRVAEVGDRVRLGEYELVVESMAARSIDGVRIRLVAGEGADDD
jgi:CBS domain containing-hemolysin-like protein